MRKRSGLAAAVTAAVLALGLLLLLHGGDDGNVSTEQEIRPGGDAPARTPPTLASRKQTPLSEPTHVTPPPTAPEPAVRLRVIGNSAPLPGAEVSIEHLGSDVETASPSRFTTGEDGRAAVPVDDASFPLAIVVRGPARYVPQAVAFAERPDDEILVDLEAGQALTVHAIDIDREPLAGIPVIVYPIEPWSCGNTGMTRTHSGWALEDSRRVTTGADGTVVVDGLDPSRLYRAHAPGYGVPAQIVPPPKVPQPTHDAVRPGPGNTLVLMLAPLRIVWARAVDAESGEAVSMPWFRPFFAPDRRPKEQDALLRAVPPQTTYGVLGLSESVRSEDYFRMYAMGQPGADDIPTGPFRVDAPGYETTELLLPALARGNLSWKPMEVRLRRQQGAVFAPLAIHLRTSRSRVRAIVQLRRNPGPRDLLYRGFDSESGEADIEARVALGTYELFVGGTSMGQIEVRGPEPIGRTVNLDELPSLQVSLSVGGVPYSGVGSVAMAGPAGSRWMFIHARIPYRDGLSPDVIVPAGQLTVTGGTGDGRYLKDYEFPSIAPGEKATIELRLP